MIINHLLCPCVWRRPHWWRPMSRGRTTRATNISARKVSMSPKINRRQPLYPCVYYHVFFVVAEFAPNWRSAWISQLGLTIHSKHSLPPFLIDMNNMHGVGCPKFFFCINNSIAYIRADIFALHWSQKYISGNCLVFSSQNHARQIFHWSNRFTHSFPDL